VEIFTNGSGSHHQLRKLDVRLSLIKNAMNKSGGVYLYSNLQGKCDITIIKRIHIPILYAFICLIILYIMPGCDGNRLYFDGSSLICVNGELVSQASQFSMNDVEVGTKIIIIIIIIINYFHAFFLVNFFFH
jgi:NAD+ synthase (glutamine-hydrolysing)